MLWVLGSSIQLKIMGKKTCSNKVNLVFGHTLGYVLEKFEAFIYHLYAVQDFGRFSRLLFVWFEISRPGPGITVSP